MNDITRRLSPEELAAVSALASEMQNEADKDKSPSENLCAALSKRTQDINVAQTVEGIISGIKMVDETFADAQNGNLSDVISDKLSEIISGKTVREQYEVLTAV